MTTSSGETFTSDCVVIGAGVIGLAVARALQLAGMQTLLLERNRGIGQETSSRNSEVVHGGMYYAPGSLKARLCVQGRGMLYAHCERNGVPVRRLGKLIVAVEPGEEETLRKYERTARANGVEDLSWQDRADVARLEPAVRASAALLSPSTGIVDSHAFMASLLNDFQRAGGDLVLDCPVACGAVGERGIELRLGDAEATRVLVRRVVNSAGLHAPAVASRLEGFPSGRVPTARFAVGHYFSMRGRSPFSHLVYPIAVPGGLGVHVTLDMAGAVRFGPDVEWRDSIDYTFDEARAPSFYQAIRRYYPGLPDGALVPAYTGIRPKISGPDEPAADFVIQSSATHGIEGLVNLFGIESPGLTSSLAIAEDVVRLLT